MRKKKIKKNYMNIFIMIVVFIVIRAILLDWDDFKQGLFGF